MIRKRVNEVASPMSVNFWCPRRKQYLLLRIHCTKREIPVFHETRLTYDRPFCYVSRLGLRSCSKGAGMKRIAGYFVRSYHFAHPLDLLLPFHTLRLFVTCVTYLSLSLSLSLAHGHISPSVRRTDQRDVFTSVAKSSVQSPWSLQLLFLNLNLTGEKC